ncbi:hypothetical protein Ani05nite_46660 [Amorphoplanes nipponensis]|uniref:Uncharacterized protein n=1 Tax=Actinoplanes nipponensis TaxID=135950 RepID=A0A919JL39_9ACTN|nr:hypothetical protein [Actinoplanes nipponensis]GIE51132.1 hypothetical protein Ani05nite_46660 [Actinoplanes nipponensis]
MPEEHRRGPLRVLAPTLGASVLLSVAYLLAPAMGTDLAAQQARAEFFAGHGWAPVDFGWYGGVGQFGYSLLTAPLGALIGMRLLGALASVAASVAFGWLLWRTGVRRPVVGALAGVLVFAANLVSGRVTFAVGLALALAALCAAAAALPYPGSPPAGRADPAPPPAGRADPAPPLAGRADPAPPLAGRADPAPPPAGRDDVALPLAGLDDAGHPRSAWRRRALVAAVFLLSALATWASPVAGLFAGLAGAAVLLTAPVGAALRAGSRVASRAGLRSWRPDGRWPQALSLCLGPVLALAPMAVLFGNGGRQPFTAESMKIHIALAVVVVLVVPRRLPAVRIAGALTVVLLLGAFYLPSPIGSNALRLPMLFTIPVLAAVAELGRVRLALLLVAVWWWQPFLVAGDLGRAGSPESRPAFHRSLVAELAGRAPGRIEVVPLRDHWESVYAAARVPLARGWERQVDTDRNALFYGDELTPQQYVAWLRANAVSYVAIAPGAVPDRYARAEAALVQQGLPELRPVWQDGTWRLYEVTGAQPLVSSPARLLRSDRGGVELGVPARGDVLVRVRWSRWLTVAGAGACLTEGPDGWTVLRVAVPGDYRLTSSLRPAAKC